MYTFAVHNIGAKAQPVLSVVNTLIEKCKINQFCLTKRNASQYRHLSDRRLPGPPLAKIERREMRIL